MQEIIIVPGGLLWWLVAFWLAASVIAVVVGIFAAIANAK